MVSRAGLSEICSSLMLSERESKMLKNNVKSLIVLFSKHDIDCGHAE
jgi:hypothetical protein